jgi:hypothetical protein
MALIVVDAVVYETKFSGQDKNFKDMESSHGRDVGIEN